MEMIAMLGGLGAGPYIEKPSEKARGVIAAINGAKSVADIDAILNGLPVMGLAANEVAVLQAAAISKREQLLTPFWRKPLYWVGVAAVAWVGYRVYKKQPILPKLNGLGASPLPRAEGVDKRGRKVKLVVKKDRDWGEWQVKVYVDGKFSEDETGFFGSDKEDAIRSFAAMKADYGLAGLGAGWGAGDRYKINPGSRKGAAANPKSGWKTFDPYSREKEVIGQYDDAMYRARKKAKGLRRKARAEARKAGK